MSDLLKVNACVYSRKGYEQDQNRDDFYMNGKFLSEHHIDNMEASIENRASEFFFAIADHMEYSDDEQKANFSILRELGKFHEKITVHEGDIDTKTKELNIRVTETAKYLQSFHDINGVSEEAPERQMGFGGLLLTDGKAVVSTYGNSRVYFCRGGVSKQITAGHSKPKRMVDFTITSDEETEELDEKYNEISDEVSVSASDPIELQEGDKFLLISDGVYNTLGQELIEDILLMRSDSTYIAYRIVNEAMKRNCSDDMTAMVVHIERIKTSSSSSVAKRPTAKPKASALKNVPPPTYKYKKKNIRKYENIIYYAAVFLTAILLILIMYFVIKNIMNSLNDPGDVVISPTPIVTLTPTPTPEITPEVTPEVTPTEAPVQITEYTVQRGDTLSSIARKHYGDNYAYVEKLGKYNNIPAPYDTIVLGQKLKIPPLEVLLEVE